MRCTFQTVFYVNGSKGRNGIVPIMGRVTINGTIAQFSCKQSVTKAIWDAKGNRAIGKSKEAKEVNFVLDNIKAQIAKHYQRLSDREAFVTAEMVRNAYQGIGTEYETLLRAFDKENAAFAKRVGKDRAKNTYNKYLVVRKYVAEFIKYQYKRSDMSMNELTEEFIRDYCLYLKNVVGLAQSSIWIYSIPLKHIVTTAHYNGKIPRNPFAMYHVDPDHKEREFLTLDELTAMTEIKLEDPNMAFARDLFIFGCWTGISFIDIKNLMEDSHCQQIGEMQQQHQAEVEKLTSKHSSEVTTLNGIIRKAKRWFPMLEARLQMENLCQKIGFTAEQTGVILTGKALEYSGLLYSEEHKRKFNVENAEIKVFSDSTKPNQLFLYINRQPIVEWFKEQWDNLWRVTKCRLKL